MEKQPVSAQPLLSKGARGKKGSTAVADTEESPRTANFDLWEDAPPEKDTQCCGVSWRCGVALRRPIFSHPSTYLLPPTYPWSAFSRSMRPAESVVTRLASQSRVKMAPVRLRRVGGGVAG